MRINTGLKVLAGAVALALSGGAFANVTTTTGSAGTIFLTVNDETNGDSYLYDTGISVSSFTGASSLTPINLTSDTNYQDFVSAEGAGDLITYSVLGGGNDTGQNRTLLYTATSTPSTTSGANLSAAFGEVSSYLGASDEVTTSSTDSVFVTGNSNAEWFAGSYEGALQGKLQIADNQAPGSAIDFYESTTSHSASAVIQDTVSELAGVWELATANGQTTLSYTVSAVPLPTPLLLLLSGLGLMGVVARRGKSGAGEVGMSASAA